MRLTRRARLRSSQCPSPTHVPGEPSGPYPSAEPIAQPFTTFLRLATPVATPSAADTALTFTPAVIGGAPTSLSTLAALALDGDQRPVLFAADPQQVHRLEPAAAAPPFPGAAAGITSLLALDWNHDFKMDLVAAGPAGVRLFIQSADGAFTDETSRASGAGGPAAVDATGVWAADVEMDGDLDIVVGVRAATTLVLRNNGDGTWRPLQPFPDATGVRAFVWGDIDGDGDPDAVSIDESGALQVFANLQAGQFKRFAAPPSREKGYLALAIGDVNADGALDLVTLETLGAIDARRSPPRGGTRSRGPRGRNLRRESPRTRRGYFSPTSTTTAPSISWCPVRLLLPSGCRKKVERSNG